VLARFWLFNPYLIPVAIAPLFLIQRSFALLARLGESEERFRTMFEGAPTGTIIIGLDERVVSSNRAFEKLAGHEKEELVGIPLGELIPDEDGHAEPLRELLDGTREA
jgi:PAS domain-containing protein